MKEYIKLFYNPFALTLLTGTQCHCERSKAISRCLNKFSGQ